MSPLENAFDRAFGSTGIWSSHPSAWIRIAGMSRLIKKEVVIGDCRLLLGDCVDVMLQIGSFDACVMDPPYGIGESAGKAKTRTSGLTSKLKDAQQYRRDYGDKKWDDKTQDEAVALAIWKSTNSIVFGGNYYDLKPSSCWLVWDKENGATDFADCELAWTNLPKAVRRLRFLWNGCMRRERHIAREHPTQKPVGVMEWCIEHLPSNAETILDPFMGSGTTGVACVKLGRKFTGIEIDPDYFEIACERIRNAYAQSDMFIEASKPPEPKQESFSI